MSEPLILLIETATTSCSVALSEGGRVIAVKEANERNIHASHITVFIEEVMKSSGKPYSDLEAVAISKGPGSYTGLRIGVSTAKGLCFALGIPLISVNTLEAMAKGLIKSRQLESSCYLVPMIDARRMEVYTAIFKSDLTLIEEVNAKIVDQASFDQFQSNKLILFGDGADKFKELFSERSNMMFFDFENSAAHLAELANNKLINGDLENMAYFEPFYLKDFVTTAKS
ncbi:MAG: tRNA (adenosine(37)-N6)-threonylcarbamoyltransferase complex dimerization subunit type 1 TsaB [Daejeonella sp.]|uniref:tRNA (adenosine(37)-N6)-threonylcarbamoyltransferase complex dimerization subunit type 1 TsaB n=1 Tax=Daejeonella sp. TaxID=2805397 RepID=UPI003C779DCC